MRILHVIPSVGPLRGGPSIAVRDMCRWQAQAGVDPTLVTTDDNGAGRLDVPLEVPVEQDGYTVWYFRRTTREYAFSWPITPWLLRHVREFDLVHVHAVFSYASTVAAWIARWQGVPYVVTPHGILGNWGLRARRSRLKRLSITFVERPVLEHAALVQITSAVEAAELEMLRIAASTTIIPLGIETPQIPSDPRTEAERRWPFLRGRIFALFLGRIDFKKGVDVLLPAFAQALHETPSLFLGLAGEGAPDYTAQLKAKIDQFGLDHQVAWLGFLEGPDKWLALAAADFVVMPSYSESFGMVAVEAMLAGTPIVLTEGVAVYDVVKETGSGRVVPVGDCEALAATLIELAKDADLRRRMGMAGRAAAARFAPETVTAALLECYQANLGSPMEACKA